MLLDKISKIMANLQKNADEIVIINDFSNIKPNGIKQYRNIKKIKIISLNKNLGSQKAISVGLSYLNQGKQNSIITILDSDGEDDVNKIPIMLDQAEKNEDKVVVSSRTKRQENIFFKLAYFFHKIQTLIFTLQWISYGNFSSFHSKQLKNILKDNSSWLALSSCLAKNCKIIKVKAERKKRLIGISKLSAMGLISHSLRVNAVFMARAVILSFFYSLIAYVLNILFFKYFICLILIFNFLLLVTLFKNSQNQFFNYSKLVDSITET